VDQQAVSIFLPFIKTSGIVRRLPQNQLSPNVSLLPDLPIPPSVKNDLQKLADEPLVPLQRVSKESFVIRDLEQSQEHPLGLLHVATVSEDKC